MSKNRMIHSAAPTFYGHRASDCCEVCRTLLEPWEMQICEGCAMLVTMQKPRLSGGEWHMSKTLGGKAFDIGSDDGSNIAVVNNDGDVNAGHREGVANARLFANSKRLLQRSQELLKVLVSHGIVIGPEHDAMAALYDPMVALCQVIDEIGVEL
jgi:hypothetical protein